MASPVNRTESRRPAPRLYLLTPTATDPGTLARPLAAALTGADVAAVLLRLAVEDERGVINAIKALAPAIQDRGAALLLDGHADLAARGGADGAHLTGVDEFQAALQALKPVRIAGCGGLESRHDAMVAAESGADYVMFGEPDADGSRPQFEMVIERITWWAEVFEVPCVGFAADFDEAEALVAAGADFIAMGDSIFADARGPQAAAAEAAKRLLRAEPVG
jgi:thiamine-phosphate pyrophosphorylase